MSESSIQTHRLRMEATISKFQYGRIVLVLPLLKLVAVTVGAAFPRV